MAASEIMRLSTDNTSDNTYKNKSGDLSHNMESFGASSSEIY